MLLVTHLRGHLQGRIFEDPSLPELQPQEREAAYHALATTLAALHSVKPQDVGLQRYGRPAGYCARQVCHAQTAGGVCCRPLMWGC